jgi:hypothetical protein
MDELMDLMIADDSPSEVSDAIKNALYQKAAERIEFARPYVADAMFGLQNQEDDETDADEIGEIDNELETEEDE